MFDGNPQQAVNINKKNMSRNSILFMVVWIACLLYLPAVVHGNGIPASVFSLPYSLQIINQADTSGDNQELSFEEEYNRFMDRGYKAVKIHKALAFTTGGLLLASGAVGVWHFLDMRQKGHRYCDSAGYTEENGNPAIMSGGVKQAWQTSESQTMRVIHGALIASSVITYTATATIELAMPRMIKNNAPFSSVNVHRYLFFLHAGLMAANVILGFAESKALSDGNHDLMMGLGATHMVVGFSAPIVMMVSGIVYKIPMQ
jgi:hypothetical protein